MKSFQTYLEESKLCTVCGFVFDKTNMDKHPTGEGFWMFEYQDEKGRLLAIDTPSPMMLREAEIHIAKQAKAMGIPEGTTFQIRFK